LKPAQRWTLVAAVLGSGIVFLDSSVVNVALPQIGRQLPVHLFGVLEGQTYVYSGYLLTLSALLILAGAINDYYGRRRVFAIGLVGFGLTSILCGLAPNLELLVVFRLLQGAAGALLVPGSLSLIAAAFSGPGQARAYGIWAGATSGTTLLGPFVGGVLGRHRLLARGVPAQHPARRPRPLRRLAARRGEPGRAGIAALRLAGRRGRRAGGRRPRLRGDLRPAARVARSPSPSSPWRSARSRRLPCCR